MFAVQTVRLGKHPGASVSYHETAAGVLDHMVNLSMDARMRGYAHIVRAEGLWVFYYPSGQIESVVTHWELPPG